MRLLLFFVVLILPSLAAAEIVVEAARIPQPPAAAAVAAGYMTIHNRSAETMILRAAASGVAEHVELHTHSHSEGKMQMRKIDRVEIPAGESIEFKPGGLHLMLIGLKGPLKDKATVTLEFESGERIEQSFLIAPTRG